MLVEVAAEQSAGPASLSMKYWVNFKFLEPFGNWVNLTMHCIGIISQKLKVTKP